MEKSFLVIHKLHHIRSRPLNIILLQGRLNISCITLGLVSLEFIYILRLFSFVRLMFGHFPSKVSGHGPIGFGFHDNVCLDADLVFGLLWVCDS